MTGLADFHDGYVDGVLLSPSGARILLRTVEEGKFTLVLSRLEALRVNDLKKGNIIFEVKLLQLREIEASFVFEVHEYSDEHKKTFVLDEWVEKAAKKGLAALEITPSYGCSILAIFNGYTLLDGHVYS
jgi:hypothetical protein